MSQLLYAASPVPLNVGAAQAPAAIDSRRTANYPLPLTPQTSSRRNQRQEASVMASTQMSASSRPSLSSSVASMRADLNASPPQPSASSSKRDQRSGSSIQVISSRAMPRTASVDSNNSSTSSQLSLTKQQAVESVGTSPADVASVLAQAGSPEAAVTQLLRDKQHQTVENAQLWRLVEKQRSMIMGLSKDLERITKEKERYRRKLKEQLALAEQQQQLYQAQQADRRVNGTSAGAASDARVQTMRDNEAPSRSSYNDENDRTNPSQNSVLKGGNRALPPKELALSDGSAPGALRTPKSFTEKISSPATPQTRNMSIDGSPQHGESSFRVTPGRKAPPVPLALGGKPQDKQAPPRETSIERGRRLTREADDVAREQVASSRSGSHKSAAPVDPTANAEMPPPPAVNVQQASPPGAAPRTMKAIAPINIFNRDNSDTPDIGSVLGGSPSSTASLPLAALGSPIRVQTAMRPAALNLGDKPLVSPGLPLSPRPMDRPLASPKPLSMTTNYSSPPLSPRIMGLPMSPRALKSGFPQPPSTPMSQGSFRSDKNAALSISTFPQVPSDGKSDPGPKQIYRGFATDEYPGLLLPPNAMPMVEIRVSSSFMKRSKANIATGKAPSSGEEAIFTLAIHGRSESRELWRTEKDASSLAELESRLAQVSDFALSAPDKSMFDGQAPAKVDARRDALEGYFDTLLNHPMDDKAALVVCEYFSSDVVDPGSETSSPELAQAKPIDPDSLPTKDGYLTKRGKQFGGWKARYFVLEKGLLKYYEAPGGSLLGIIKLFGAQIGKQSASQSPVDNDDPDKEYRHAFLILEPKRKDSKSTVKHVLCAESDADRDAWVDSLLHYVDYEEEEKTVVKSRQHRDTSARRQGKATPESDDSPNTLKVVSYESTVAGAAPQKSHETPSPVSAVNSSPVSNPASHKQISGPKGGVKIEDASSWGNIPAPAGRKRSLFWGLKGRSSTDLERAAQNANPEPRYSGRAVFGINLGDAVEICPPTGVDIYLPAVVYRCIEYLDAKNASHEEGIFRMSGSNLVIKNLKDRFNQEGDIRLLEEETYYDVHAIASLLKLYLRELPQTILTRELHLDFLAVLDLRTQVEKLVMLNGLVRQLPRANRALLQAVSSFLVQIVDNSHINKMTIRNVGIVFSPTLNIPAPLISLLVQDFESIFLNSPDSTTPTGSPVKAPPPPSSRPPPPPSSGSHELTMDDIRSPRKQMFQDLPTPMQSEFPRDVQQHKPHPSQQPQQQQQSHAAMLLNGPMSPRGAVGFTGLHNQHHPHSQFQQPQQLGHGSNGPPRSFAAQSRFANQPRGFTGLTQANPEESMGNLNSALLQPIPSSHNGGSNGGLDPNSAAGQRNNRRESMMMGVGMSSMQHENGSS